MTLAPARQETRFSDSSKLRMSSFTKQFLIGAEFEIYFKAPSARKLRNRQAANGARMDQEYTVEMAKADILAVLKIAHPDIAWAKELSFCTDGSLDYDLDGECGIEIILKHTKGPRALALIGKILRCLSQSRLARTNSECGLHFNVSYADPAKNTQAMLASVSEHAPVKRMLARFRRSKNEHCRDNSDDRFDTSRVVGSDGSDLVELISKAHGGPAMPNYDARLNDFAQALAKLSNPKTLANFQRLAMLKARAILLEAWEDDRPACAPRFHGGVDEKSLFKSSAKNYCEFRMMGGVDYHRRAIDVASTMQECLWAMESAHKSTRKDLERHAKARAKAAKPKR